MATGRLAAVQTNAGTNTTVYTVPTGKVASFTLNILNSASIATTVSIALAANGSPTTAEYIEMDVALDPNGVIERTGLVLDAGKVVVVNSGAAVSAVIYGYEE